MISMHLVTISSQLLGFPNFLFFMAITFSYFHSLNSVWKELNHDGHETSRTNQGCKFSDFSLISENFTSKYLKMFFEISSL